MLDEPRSTHTSLSACSMLMPRQWVCAVPHPPVPVRWMPTQPVPEKIASHISNSIWFMTPSAVVDSTL